MNAAVLLTTVFALLLVACGRSGSITAPSFDELPESARAKIQSEVDPGQITRIEQENEGKRVIYHVSFQHEGKRAKISVAQNGMLLSDSRNPVIHEPAGAPLSFGTVSARSRFNSLPSAVQKAIGERSTTRLEIVNVQTTERSGQALYEIEFGAPGRNPRMYVLEDGTVIEDQRDAFRQ